MKNNESVQCKEKATLRYTWPGQNEDYVCIGCATKLNMLAGAMGFNLQLLTLAEVQIDESLQCSSIIKGDKE